MSIPFSEYEIQFNPFAVFAIVTAMTLFFFIYLFPMVKILHRTGYNGWWVLLVFVPAGNAIALWCFAFGRWPAVQPTEK